MKLNLLFLLFFTSLSNANSINDTIFYNSKWNIIEKKEVAKFFKTIEFTSSDSTSATRKIFYISGKLKSEQKYSNYKKRIKNGSFNSWYENGQLEFECNYKTNQLEGLVNSFWGNGKIKRKDNFSEGKLNEGKCFDIDGNTITHYDFIKYPEFPGGMQAFANYTAKNYRTPNVEKNIKGKIFACFEVDLEGDLHNIQIIKSLDPSLDLEYLRMLSKLPKWSACKIENEATYFEYTLPLALDIHAE